MCGLSTKPSCGQPSSSTTCPPTSPPDPGGDLKSAVATACRALKAQADGGAAASEHSRRATVIMTWPRLHRTGACLQNIRTWAAFSTDPVARAEVAARVLRRRIVTI
jgi:hypothetical protein